MKSEEEQIIEAQKSYDEFLKKYKKLIDKVEKAINNGVALVENIDQKNEINPAEAEFLEKLNSLKEFLNS